MQEGGVTFASKGDTMYSYTIPDISCGGCAKAVTRIVERLDAQARVAVDLGTKRVEVETRASDADVRAALARGGYPPAAG